MKRFRNRKTPGRIFVLFSAFRASKNPLLGATSIVQKVLGKDSIKSIISIRDKWKSLGFIH